MQDYSIRSDYLTNYYPQCGWGEKFQEALDPNMASVTNVIAAGSAVVVNWALGGRSTRMFWEEGRWAQVEALLQPDDYVFVQFGHNDAASCTDYPDRCTSVPQYQEYLRMYVDASRAKGAIPVLVTPINRNYPWSNGTISSVHGDYPGAMKAVAMEKHAPLIDGTQRSLDLFNSVGQAFTTSHYFMVFDAGAYPNFKVTTEYPNGSPSNDNTHFQIEGATAVAQLVVEGLQDVVDVQVTVQPAGCGTVSGAGWYEKKYTSAVSIQATANTGCTFTGWSGDASGTANPAQVSVNGNKTITAQFSGTPAN